MSFGLGLIAGAGQRITQMADQEREERMLEERMTRQEDFQREMAGLRHGYSLELQGLREAAAQRKEEAKQQAAVTDAYTLFMASGEDQVKLQSIFDSYSAAVERGDLSWSAAIKDMEKFKGVDLSRVVMRGDATPEVADTIDGAISMKTGITEDVIRESSPTVVRKPPSAPESPAPEVVGSVETTSAGTLPRLTPAPIVPGTEAHRFASSIIAETADAARNTHEQALSNFIREVNQSSDSFTSETRALIANALTATQNARGDRGVVDTAFAAATRERLMGMHPDLNWESVFLSTPTYQDSQEVSVLVESVARAVPEGTARQVQNEDGSVEIKPITDEERLMWIEELIRNPAVPLIAIPVSVWREYHRITSQQVQQAVTGRGTSVGESLDNGSNRGRGSR